MGTLYRIKDGRRGSGCKLKLRFTEGNITIAMPADSKKALYKDGNIKNYFLAAFTLNLEKFSICVCTPTGPYIFLTWLPFPPTIGVRVHSTGSMGKNKNIFFFF